MSGEQVNEQNKIWLSIFSLVVSLLIVLWGGIVLRIGFLIPLLAAATFASLVGLWMRFSWSEIQQGILRIIDKAMIAGIILLLVGILIGVWIASGTIPYLIYLGLKILTPGTFLAGAFIFTSIFSIATGTSFGTIGTAGLALLGIGEVLGYPAGLTVGAIVSGAYIGDKMSPVSDTTNVASAITDTNLFRHIYSMIYTTLPAAILCLIIYGVVGMRYGGGQLPSEIEVVMTGLAENFNLSIVTLIPPILLIVLAAVFRMPAIPTLVISIFAGVIVAVVLQNIGFTQVLQVATSGFVPETGIELIDGLLKRGGIESMFSTVALMICALILGGVLEGTKVLDILVHTLLKTVKTVGGLIVSVLASCYLLLAGTGNVFVSIIVPGRAFSSAFKEKKIDSSVLSRTLEDAATVGSPLIPWSLAAIFTSGVLQISPLEFIPFTFLSMLVPIFSIIYGLTGFAIFKEKGEYVKEDGKDTVSSV